MKPNPPAKPRAPSVVVPSPAPESFWAHPLPPPVTTCRASEPPTKLAPSQQGVKSLLTQAVDAETARLLAQAYSPLFPESTPYTSLADIPDKRAIKDAPILKAVGKALDRYQARLLADAGYIAEYLHYSEDDVRALAIRLAHEAMPPLKKVEFAEKLLRMPIPGKSLQARLARLSDARFWRRAIRVRILRAREHFFLRLGLIGKGREAYASEVAVKLRGAQLKRQQEWMKATVLIPRQIEEVQGEEPYEPLTLEQVAAGPRERFAKLYTFVKAVDVLAQEAGLSAAMVTLTLEPEWHPSPSHGQNSWNDSSPRDAHQSLCHRWQAILRDLHRAGIRLSGLRVAEPHADACPHWHIWMLYRPEYETRILSTVMRYFPNKLKVRSPSATDSGKPAPVDTIYDTRDNLLTGTSRPLRHPNEGAQVEVSRIDRNISSGASYAMKYLLKTVDAGDELNREAGLFAGDDAATRKKKAQHADNAKRVDAYRSTWGLNRGQLFGIAKCLTVWDELRRMAFAPKHKVLRQVWALARGSEKEGRIEAGAGQRGDAVGFIKALGGLDAARSDVARTTPRLVFGRLVEEALNAYGETVGRTKGITLLQKQKVRIARTSISSATGKTKTRHVWRTETTVVASVRSRWIDWMLVPKALAKHTLALPQVLAQHAIEQAEIERKRKEAKAAAAAAASSPPPSQLAALA